MTREPRISRDGTLDFLGGVDSGRIPSLLAPNQAAWAGNISVRGGSAKTRSRFFQLPLAFANDEQEAWILNHAVQGVTIFAPRYREAVQVVSIGGRIFEINMTTFAVIEVTPHVMTQTNGVFVVPAIGAATTITVTDSSVIPIGLPIEIEGGRYLVVSISGQILTVTNIDATAGGASGATVMALDPNASTLGRAWMQQAELFLIIQDGQRRAIIYDGSKSFRSDIVKQQVPTGKQMAYGKGRLWVAVNESEYVAGDIVGGQEHDLTYPKRLDAVLYFTENTFLAGGGSFSTPLLSGAISAMIFMAVLDTSTGNGPLLIFTDGGLIFSCNASEDRDAWQKTSSPLQTIVSIGSGAVSHYAVAQTTNSDIFFRAPDGVRSFYLAVREFVNSWGSTPNSTEMDRVLPFDDKLLLKYGSMIQFDNRLLFTVQPMPTLENAYHRGLGVLDFNLISSMHGKAPPVYEGVWTGFQPVLLFKGNIGGKERAFSWARNAAGLNELWEFDKISGFDNTDARVPSFIETRSMFGREPTASPLSWKRIESVEIWVDQIQGTVDFELFYKPDQYPCWVEWGRTQAVCSEYQTCADEDEPLCTVAYVKRPTFKTRLNFGQPLDEDMDVDDKPSRIGYEFQLRLGWTGHCRIRKVLVRFLDRDDEMFPVVS